MKRLIATLHSHGLFTLILVGYLGLALGFSLVDPIYESSDELHHFRYIRYIQDFRELPAHRADQPRILAHHPPLYYVIAALITAPIPPDRPALYEPVHNPYALYRYWEINNDNKNQYLHGPDEVWPYSGVVLIVHVARWVNILIGAIMVWVTYRLALTIFDAHSGRKSASEPPDSRPARALASAVTAIVAFNPQFLFISSAVNNDVIAGLFGSILLWLGVTIIRYGLTTRRSILLALAYAFALMAKFSLAFALPLVELALLITIWPRAGRERDWRSFVKANLFIVVAVALIAGWWFVRNLQLYGEPTGVRVMNEMWGARNPTESVGLAISEIPYAWSSFWGRFGYGQVPLPDALYTGALIVSLVGLVGLVIAFARKQFDRVQLKQLALVIFSALLFAAALFGYMLTSTAGAMGRFYFPSLSAFGLLLALGWTTLFTLRMTRYSTLVARYAIPIAAFAFALVAFFGYFIPAYAAPPKVDAASVAQPLHVTFDGQIELVGAQVDRGAAQPGDPIKVTLYWRATAPFTEDYSVFLNALRPNQRISAQDSSKPLRDTFSTKNWPVGQVITDVRVLQFPPTAKPGELDVEVGWFLPKVGRLSVLATDEHEVDTRQLLSKIQIREK